MTYSEGCAHRIFRFVNTETLFSASYVLPIKGMVTVAFKQAIRIAEIDDSAKVWPLGVDILINIAKVLCSDHPFSCTFPQTRGHLWTKLKSMRSSKLTQPS